MALIKDVEITRQFIVRFPTIYHGLFPYGHFPVLWHGLELYIT